MQYQGSLHAKLYQEIEIASVDAFQGREKVKKNPTKFYSAIHLKLLPTAAQAKKHTVNFANFYFFMFRTFSALI